MNAAKQRSFTGEIVDITGDLSGKDSSKGAFRFISVVDTKGVTHRVITSLGQLEGFSLNGLTYREALHQGSKVNVTVEERVKDTTEYLDEKGEVKVHTNSGEALVTVLPLSSFQSQEIAAEIGARAAAKGNLSVMEEVMQKKMELMTSFGFSREEMAIAFR